MKVLKICFLVLILLKCQNVLSQSKESGIQLFNEAKYIEAAAELADLHGQFSADPVIGLYYAAALVNSQQSIPKAIEVLESLDLTETSGEVHFYLGKAHLLNYNGAEALLHFKLFEESVSEGERRKFRIGQYKLFCENLIRNSEYFGSYQLVTEKKISINRAYELVPGLGNEYKCSTIQEVYKSRQDNKRVNYFNFLQSKTGKETYYASFGKSGSNGLDLYYSYQENRKSKPEKPEYLGTYINSGLNEINPVAISSHEIYFCSNGPASMGGYDVFKARFNSEQQRWEKPVNMGFPINTPYDDYLFIPGGNHKDLILFSNRNCRIDSSLFFRISKKDEFMDADQVWDYPSLSIFREQISRDNEIAELEDDVLFSILYKDEIQGVAAVHELINTDVDFILKAIDDASNVKKVCQEIYDFKVRNSILKRKEANKLMESYSELKSEESRIGVEKSKNQLLQISGQIKIEADFTEDYIETLKRRIERLKVVVDNYGRIGQELSAKIIRAADAVDYINEQRIQLNKSSYLFWNMADDLNSYLQIEKQKTQLFEESNGLLSEISLRLSEYKNSLRSTTEDSDARSIQDQIQKLQIEYELAQRKGEAHNLDMNVRIEQRNLMEKLLEEVEQISGPIERELDTEMVIEEPVPESEQIEPLNIDEPVVQASVIYKHVLSFPVMDELGWIESLKLSDKEKAEFNKHLVRKDAPLYKDDQLKDLENEYELLQDQLQNVADNKKKKVNKKAAKILDKQTDLRLKQYTIRSESFAEMAGFMAVQLSKRLRSGDAIIDTSYVWYKQSSFGLLQEAGKIETEDPNSAVQIMQFRIKQDLLDNCYLNQMKAVACYGELAYLDSVPLEDTQLEPDTEKKDLHLRPVKELENCFVTIQLDVVGSLDRDSLPVDFSDFIIVPFNDQFKISTGEFKSVQEARIKLKDIKIQGYSDAFIVAYLKGRKIALGEAARILSGVTGIPETSVSAKEIKSGSESFYSVQIGVFSREIQPEWVIKEGKDLYKSSLPNGRMFKYSVGKFADYKEAKRFARIVQENYISDAFVVKLGDKDQPVKGSSLPDQAYTEVMAKTSVDIKSVDEFEGLVFTVQIGVLNRLYEISYFKGLTELYVQQLNKIYKYYSGSFESETLANLHKNEVRAMGFTDAFVVSFKDGQRTLLPSGGNQLKGKASKPKNEKEADQFVAKKKLVNPTVIKFKIQIALFKTSAPEDEISRFVKLAGEYGLSDFLDINGNTLYTIGEFDDYEEALRVRVELMEQGASDSFIVAFKGYEKIPVSEAIRLINNR